MALRTLSQIVADAIAYITEKRPSLATFSGTVTRDIVIESPAQEFVKVYDELSHTQKLSSLVYASELTTDELDAIASNYNMTRLNGTSASGTVTFQIRNFTTSSANVIVPVGAVVGTVGTSETPLITFVTTQAGQFLASAAPSYLNPTTGLYELTLPVASEQIGTLGNVGAGTITILLTSVSGIDTIVNTVATSGGVDIESNTDFGLRIRQRLAGNNIGTPAGIESLVRSNANVTGIAIVTPNDPEMLRNEFGGSVDVYVVGETLVAGSESRLYQTTGTQEFILGRQPAKAINSITGIVLGAPYTFVDGVDYNFVADPTTLLDGSARMQNKVVFNIGGTNPDNSTNILINYTYNSLIVTLQAELDSNENHIVTSDILVKEGKEATIDLTFSILILPGFIGADVVTSIQDALTTHINSLSLGDNIDRSDIVGVVEGVDGVDQLDLNSLVMSKNGTPIPLSQQRLSIQKTEYPRVNSISIALL